MTLFLSCLKLLLVADFLFSSSSSSLFFIRWSYSSLPSPCRSPVMPVSPFSHSVPSLAIQLSCPISDRPGQGDPVPPTVPITSNSWFPSADSINIHNTADITKPSETINRTQSMVYVYIQTLDNSKDNRKIIIINF